MSETNHTDRSALAGAARKGVFSSGYAALIRNVLDFVTSIILARLLLPEEFGVVAVVAVFIGLSWVVGNLGMGGALIQARALTRQDIDASFTVSVAVGLATTLVLVALSPLVAQYFGFDELRAIMPVMSMQLLFAGLEAAPLALLRRNLQFQQIAWINIAGALANSAIGIGLALAGFGVWSLALSPLLSRLLTLLLAFGVARYLPRLSFARESYRKLLGYGSTLTVKNVFVYLARNADNFVVAKGLGAEAAGFYSRGFNYSSLPDMRILPLLYSVCFPVFCQLQDEPRRLLAWFGRIQTMVAVGVAPLLVGLSVTAGDFTLALLGEKWAGMIQTLQILSIAGLLNCLHKIGGAAIEASGRLRYEVITMSAYAFLVPVGALIGLPWGIDGVSWAILVANVLFFFMKGFALRSAIGLPLVDYLRPLLPALMAAVTMGVVLYLSAYSETFGLQALRRLDSWQRLVLVVPAGALVYFSALALLGRSHLRLALAEVKKLAAAGRSAPPPGI